MVAAPGDDVIRAGETGREMYLVSRGDLEVLDESGKRVRTLSDGDFFGEIALLTEAPRSMSVRALSHCDLFVLSKADLRKSLWGNPGYLEAILAVAAERYRLAEEVDLAPAAPDA